MMQKYVVSGPNWEVFVNLNKDKDEDREYFLYEIASRAYESIFFHSKFLVDSKKEFNSKIRKRQEACFINKMPKDITNLKVKTNTCLMKLSNSKKTPKIETVNTATVLGNCGYYDASIGMQELDKEQE